MKKEYNEFILSEFCLFSCKILFLLNIVNILEKAIKKGQQKIIIKKREKKTHSRQNNIHVDEWEKWGIDAPPHPLIMRVCVLNIVLNILIHGKFRSEIDACF